MKVGLERNFGGLTTHFLSITANNFIQREEEPPSPPSPPSPTPGLAHVESRGRRAYFLELPHQVSYAPAEADPEVE